ncbi:MAG: YafY family transcriptional regulator [Oscillospiraceae bacterium]|jgi:predicted DNA-binding transcriptional regulator YafY|nr:YafY family transcriptional regulator [Oscillospiraceae bacterium]
MKLDRLIGILTLLLQTEKITAPALAERFGVSRRTILRDVEALCLAGIPVVTTRGGDSGIAIMPGYKIDKAVLTAEELQSLVAGLRGVDSVARASQFEGLMAKLAPANAMVNLTGSVVIDLSSHYRDSLSEKIALLKDAIARRRTVRFTYYYPKGETPRALEPYFVEFRWSAWYVFGWCRLREDFRRFKLNRLWDLELTDESFDPRAVPPEQASAETVFPGPEPGHIEILFDKSMRFRLIESYGLHCYEERPDGLFLPLDYTNREYIFSWILGFGDKAEVLAPEEARAAFAALAKNLFLLYR